jgi:hypothetical protein
VNMIRQVVPALLATALAAGLAACGAAASSSAGSAVSSSAGATASSSSGGAGAGNGASSQSASTSTDPLASLTATQVFNKAIADTSAASSLHLVGSGDNAGHTITFTLDIAEGTGCAGALAEGSMGSFQLILLGKTVYLKPDATFWKSAVGATAGAALSLLEGKYLKGTTSSSGLSSISQLCSLNQLLSQQPLTASDLTKDGVSTFGGSQVIVLKDSTTNGVAYVTDQAQPLVVRISGTGANGGTVTFSGYNVPVTITAPPASEVVDGSKYGF